MPPHAPAEGDPEAPSALDPLPLDAAGARELDARDPLAPLRQRFLIPPAPSGGDAVYFCGHSLGCQPRATRDEVLQVLDQWAERGVAGHHVGRSPWIPYHEPLAIPMAAIVGASPPEVVSMNSLTVNLHLMLASFYEPRGRRCRIAMEAHAFSSDRHAVDSHVRMRGLDPGACVLELEPRPGESVLRPDDLEATLRREGDTLALVLLPGVQYLSGELLDMARLARIGREIGARVGFDLAHAVGNVPLSLHAWDVDFAVWCSYKYLNGGPGAPGGCFVHERHDSGEALPRLAGWWGHELSTRFRMEPGFRPQPGAAAWQVSNPPILSMAALKASLALFDEVGMAALRAKSERLTAYFDGLLRRLEVDAVILTPADPARRGAQLSLRVSGGSAALAQRLAAQGFVCDSREPDVLRLAPVPFYNRFVEVHAFAHALAETCGTRRRA